MIRPASKNTGMAMTRPVMPSAQAAFSSPNLRTIVTASVCAPPETSRIAPNIEPKPTSSAMPFSVLPMPSLTEATISVRGIPAISPIEMAPTRIEIMACTLHLIMRTSRMIRPMTAARTSRVGSSVATASIEFLLFFLCSVQRSSITPYKRPSSG